jgi:hypothetical protein
MLITALNFPGSLAFRFRLHGRLLVQVTRQLKITAEKRMLIFHVQSVLVKKLFNKNFKGYGLRCKKNIILKGG